MIILGIDGMCSAGKSTIIQKLKFSEEFKDIIFTSPDYFDICRGNYPFEEGDINIVQERESQVDFFANIDSERLHSVKNSSEVIILDRSIFSILAFSYAKGKITNTPLLDVSIDILKKHNIIIPNIIIFIDIDFSKANLRNINRGIKGILSTEEFNFFFREFFIDIYPTLNSIIKPLPNMHIVPNNEELMDDIKSIMLKNITND